MFVQGEEGEEGEEDEESDIVFSAEPEELEEEEVLEALELAEEGQGLLVFFCARHLIAVHQNMTLLRSRYSGCHATLRG